MRELLAMAWRWAVLGVRYELRVYASLGRLIARRPAVAPGEEAFGYAGIVAGLMGLWIFASAAEIPLFHLITPWESVRIALLVVSVWGLVWMLGYYGSLRAFPHAVGPDGVRIQHTIVLRALVGWEQVQSVEVLRRNDVRRGVHADAAAEGVVVITVGSETNVRIRFSAEQEFATLRETLRADAVDLYLDDPTAFVAACRRHLAARTLS